jgi:hypothetical protein
MDQVKVFHVENCSISKLWLNYYHGKDGMLITDSMMW